MDVNPPQEVAVQHSLKRLATPGTFCQATPLQNMPPVVGW